MSRSAYLPPAVDWQRLALDLRSARVPLTQAAKAVGAHGDFIRQLARGEIREPKFTQGVALLNLHSDKCSSEMTARLIK